MKLLVDPKFLPPPSDYLYARIGVRIQRLDAAANDADQRVSQRQLRKEYRWVYLRLESRLRRELRPFFEYNELRLLVLCLRYLSAEEPQELSRLLLESLLKKPLRRELSIPRQVSETILRLERLLMEDYPVFQGAGVCYLRQGPGGLEQQLLGGYLAEAVSASRSAPVRHLLAYLIDMRNLLALYKHLHWQLPQSPPILNGGEIPRAIYERCWQQRDMDGLLLQVRKRAVLNLDPQVTGVEELLEEGLAKKLRRLAQEPLQIGVLLEYLWRCRQLARSPISVPDDRDQEEVVA